MNRRNFISQSALLAASAAVATSSKFAFAEGDSDSKARHHESKNQNLMSAASSCVEKGENCLQHCMDLLTAGDTSMAACSKTVRDMLIYCNALIKAAAQNSKHLKQLAAIAAVACKDCETECRKHAQKHDVCRACADSCAECYKQCKALA